MGLLQPPVMAKIKSAGLYQIQGCANADYNAHLKEGAGVFGGINPDG
jgi:hypothetical protein